MNVAGALGWRPRHLESDVERVASARHWCQRSTVAAQMLTLLTLAAFLAVPAFAAASPPDPLWESGVYDDADFDDVVITIVTLTGIPEPLVIMPHGDRGVSGTLTLLAPPRIDSPARRSFQSRAPPST